MKLTLGHLPLYCVECGDCLLWRLGVNSTGYPQATIDGRGGQMVRRYIFTVLLNREIPRGRVVSTVCDRRLCVAPNHLIAMRRGSVQERSYATGKRMHPLEYATRLNKFIAQGNAKLDWEKVRAIRARPIDEANERIAAEHGVSVSCIKRVRRLQTWRDILPNASVFAWAQSQQRVSVAA